MHDVYYAIEHSLWSYRWSSLQPVSLDFAQGPLSFVQSPLSINGK